MAFDYKKEYKEFYLPSRKPQIIEIPSMNFLAVRGQGDPNEEGGAYKASIGLLYEIAYTIKMMFYNPENGQFVLINRAGSTEEEAVFRLRLRAGQSVPAGEVSVSVENLSVSEGKEDLIPAGASLTLSAVVENPETDENLPPEEA